MYMSALKTLYGGQFTSDRIIIELGRLFPKVENLIVSIMKEQIIRFNFK